MNVSAVRLHGKNDLRLDVFPLPEIKEDEILVRIVSDSLCMSTYKATVQGASHPRVPDDVETNPVIVGHEFCGEIVKVGAKWQDKYRMGERFTVQPALNYRGSLNAPGYSYSFLGGDATYGILPPEVMETGCLIPYHGDAYFHGSLAEPISCILGALRASYHTERDGKICPGIRKDGKMLFLGGAGPMGCAAVDYVLHAAGVRPSHLVVADPDAQRLARLTSFFSSTDETTLDTVTSLTDETLRTFAPAGYDDVFVFAPYAETVALGDRLLATDGCLNFFAGPTDHELCAPINFYRVHYDRTHHVGTSGGSTQDIRDALRAMEEGKIRPETMVTHIGGLDAVADTTMNLPAIGGAKKLIYTHVLCPLVALSDLEKEGERDPMFKKLSEIVRTHGGLWSREAEEYFLANAKTVENASPSGT